MKKNQPGKNLFRFSIDRGGTFTDIYAEIPGDKAFVTLKLLSVNPNNYDDPCVEGIRRILSRSVSTSKSSNKIAETFIDWIRMGTTIATNALLERNGKRTALVISRGFKDILQIGNQSRPEIFDLQIKKPDLLYEATLEVDERVRPVKENENYEDTKCVTGITGEKYLVLEKPDPDKFYMELEGIYKSGIRSVAIVCMHAYSFHDHEKFIGNVAKRIGFSHISLSHQVMAQMKLVSRGDTTVVDAYLTPLIQSYLKSFQKGFTDSLQKSNTYFMQSDGGLVYADKFKGSNAILSGPAGGVVGYAKTTYNDQSKQPVIGFDMGGTSTDVSRFDGTYEIVNETETAGVRIQAPQLYINTVAAGGGSRLFFRNGMFQVGPESSGAHPGPVCYRKNGFLSITDANLLLGRIQPDYFPKIFGETENLPLDTSATKKAFDRLTTSINTEYKKKNQEELCAEQVALGFIDVANEAMVRPIREISVMRGYDSKEHILACFGGAGGQHACAIAQKLGIKKVFIHRFAGILSAYGLGLADVVIEKQQPCSYVYSSQSIPYLTHTLSILAQDAISDLGSQGHGISKISIKKYLNLRYEGTDTAFMIGESDINDFEKEFRSTYLREFGFDLKDRKIFVDNIRVRAIGHSSNIKKIPIRVKRHHPKPVSFATCYFEDGCRKTPVYMYDDLGASQRILGPAIVIQDSSTIFIEPDCHAEISKYGDIEIGVGEKAHHKSSKTCALDPIQLSIFSNLFMSIAEQMGRTLQKTAISVNIKERLDFSCAIFDQKGNLVANAPHIPVHLGAMSESVKQQIAITKGTLKRGDVMVTNHPFYGGSHLPDITVITPVWYGGDSESENDSNSDRERPVFYVASRGHHAEIGGISPGSMPPFSRTLGEEGAVIKSFKIVEDGIFKEKVISELLCKPDIVDSNSDLANANLGTRALADNISDLNAQVASNNRGAQLLLDMIEQYSIETVLAYMKYIQENAENAVKQKLKNLAVELSVKKDEKVSVKEYMDDGSSIVLNLSIDQNNGTAVFDFTGTSYETWGNCNAPEAVVYSAVIYSLRSIINENIPLNQGCLNPVTIIIPKGSLLSPSKNAAVVGGNVLTSQRITDTILKAFKAAAASQGCMNNLTFGNSNFGYYETIGGGAGAGPSWHGQSGIQTHMTNTRITDPEIIEKYYPVMIKQFSIRQDSGGKGKYNGGNGLIREIEFLDELEVSVLSERRVFQPYGLCGGNPGARGENIFIFQNGRTINLGGKSSIKASPGDRIIIKTPGGGGYGTPQ